MDNDLLIPLLWTVVFGTLIFLAGRKLTKKAPRDKKWVRPESEKPKKTD